MRAGDIAGVVVAAGSGQRLGAQRPKALIEVGGRPLWQWAVQALLAGGCQRVVVVTPPQFPLPRPSGGIATVPGGATRQQSVWRGLNALADGAPEVVLVHDAARALTPPDVVRRVLDAVAAGYLAVAPVVAVADTIRQLRADDTSVVVDRSALRAVQTPQGFAFATLWAAHEAAASGDLLATDDVSLCERQGIAVHLVDGDAAAFKITTPTDLAMANALAARGRS